MAPLYVSFFLSNSFLSSLFALWALPICLYTVLAYHQETLCTAFLGTSALFGDTHLPYGAPFFLLQTVASALGSFSAVSG